MSSKLKPCPSCGAMISKSARTCPQCGKTFTNAAGLIVAVLIAMAVGWLMIGKTCSQASSADKAIEEAKERLQRGR